MDTIELQTKMRGASDNARTIVSELNKEGKIDSPLALAIMDRVKKLNDLNGYLQTINKGSVPEINLGRELWDRREWDSPIFPLLAERIQSRRAHA
jgi:hypothetical protein